MIEYVFALLGILLGILYLRAKRPPNFPKGPIPFPIVGNLLQGGLAPHRTFMNMGKKYGGIFAFDIGPLPAVVITDLKIMRQILVKTGFAGRPKMQVFLDRTIPASTICRGIITAELGHWNEQRRFVLKNLKDFGAAQSTAQDIIHEEILEFTETLRKSEGKPIDAAHLFNVPILNSVWRIITGMRTHQSDPRIKEVTDVVASGLVSTGIFMAISFAYPKFCKTFPNITGYNTMLKFSKPLTDFVKEVFLEHKLTFQPGQPRDIIDAMCEQIAETTDTNSSFYEAEGELNAMKSLEDLFIGGADTTGTTMSWIFLLLALYPEQQEKVFEEIEEVIGSSRLPVLSDRSEMLVTESVIMEVLRFSGIFALSVIRSTTEDVSVCGYIIPKETVVITDLYAVLHDPDIWGDPQEFRPKRFFLEDGTLNRSHVAFIPFSYGKRVCIAEKLAREELFLFTTSLLQKFKVSLHGPRPALEVHTNVILAPNGHELIFEERNA